jgi:uncharacterized membrane protein YfcA
MVGLGSLFWLKASGVVLLAAVLNGMLGYGFSSLCAPLALSLAGPKVANPVLVLLGLALNLSSLLACRTGLARVQGRLRWMAVALLPGIFLGGALLGRLRSGPVRVGTCVLLLVFLLARGLHPAGRPPRPERQTKDGLFGFGAGLVFGLTTLSGPLFGMYFQDRGLPKGDYRAAISLIRMVESVISVLAYLVLGLMTWTTLRAVLPVLPLVILGPWLGARLCQLFSEFAFGLVAGGFNAFAMSFALGHALATSLPLPAWGLGVFWSLSTALGVALPFRRRAAGPSRESP